ncbi:MAG TPA: ATP-binding cassette domain-containing protein [Candidatus Azoamicus sp. OHIO1]
MTYIEGFFNIKLKKFTLNTTFKIPNTGITFIIGESGAGKTTFLKCLSGLISSHHGFLKIKDIHLQNSKQNIFIPPNKRSIGLVFQTPYLFPNMSVIENLKFGYNSKKITLAAIIKLLKLEKLLNRNIKTLSGGEKQRISLGQTLLTNPELILMDEPFSSQDINMKKCIMTYLKNINKEFSITIICVCHSVEEIYTQGNHLIYIDNGKIKHSEAIDKLS